MNLIKRRAFMGGLAAVLGVGATAIKPDEETYRLRAVDCPEFSIGRYWADDSDHSFLSLVTDGPMGTGKTWHVEPVESQVMLWK